MARGEPQVSVRGLLEQDPAATEEAASLAEGQIFGEEKRRQGHDAVACFQLQDRAENHEF